MAINDRNVPVYDRLYRLKGHVTAGTTSVGAARLAGTQTASLTKVDNVVAWVGKDYR